MGKLGACFKNPFVGIGRFLAEFSPPPIREVRLSPHTAFTITTNFRNFRLSVASCRLLHLSSPIVIPMSTFAATTLIGFLIESP